MNLSWCMFSAKCEIWGPHSCVDEDSGVLGCDTVSVGKLLLTSWRFIVPSSFTVDAYRATLLHSPEDSNPHFLHTMSRRHLLGIIFVDPDVKNVTCITALESCCDIRVFHISALNTEQQSFISYSVLRQVDSLFQSEFSKECYLVLPLSVSGIFSFP
jgi:hypothetical protein